MKLSEIHGLANKLDYLAYRVAKWWIGLWK